MNATTLGANGRNVRCAKCGDTWFAAPALPTPVENGETSDFAAQLNEELSSDTPRDFNLRPANSDKASLPALRSNAVRPPRLNQALIAIFVILSILAFALLVQKKSHSTTQKAGTVVLYQGTGLSFSNVHAIEKGEGAARQLVLSGSIKNDTKKVIALPVLSAKLSEKESGETMEWQFHLSQNILAPNASAEFQISKPDLKFSGNQLSLSFVYEK